MGLERSASRYGRNQPTPSSVVDLEIEVRTIRADGELVLEYHLSSPSGAVETRREPICSEPLRNPVRFEAELYERLENLHAGRGAGTETTREILHGLEIEREIEALGYSLFERLFPEPMRAAYREFRHVESVRITSDEPWIPWELVKSGDEEADDFFCLQFQLSRWLPGVPAVSAMGVARVAVVDSSGLTPRTKTPSTEGSETSRFERLEEERVEVRWIREAQFGHVDALLKDGGQDLYHFIGHGEFDAQRPDDSRLPSLGRGSHRFRRKILRTSSASSHECSGCTRGCRSQR